MNVYVRELSGALARAGVDCDVYTRASSAGLAPTVDVEPGVRVHHVAAGPLGPVPTAELPALVTDFTAGVLDRMAADSPPDLIHANYWLSGLSGHVLKHTLELPLVSTFHTLARVKAEAEDDHGLRARAEAEVIGCSDAILAACSSPPTGARPGPSWAWAPGRCCCSSAASSASRAPTWPYGPWPPSTGSPPPPWC